LWFAERICNLPKVEVAGSRPLHMLGTDVLDALGLVIGLFAFSSRKLGVGRGLEQKRAETCLTTYSEGRWHGRRHTYIPICNNLLIGWLCSTQLSCSSLYC
jgi:hypothetical protein